MSGSAYKVLGWTVWQVGSRVAKRKMAANRARIGAAGAVAAVLAGGVIAARAATSESEDD
ncbi:MAG: hypothetical protein H0V08_03330 [Thermoleophilaceae bacterium]|jgi:hypothetical protein|nr:hypothetical protein [Thermoleophilaceae bacterium]